MLGSRVRAPADSRKREGQKPSLFAWIVCYPPPKSPSCAGDLSLCSDILLNVRALAGFRVIIQPNFVTYAFCNPIKSGEIRCNSLCPTIPIPNEERSVWPTFQILKKGYDFLWNREATDLPSRPPHVCHDRNTDKRSAYRVGQQDAWASKPQNDSDIREDCQWQARWGYDKSLNQTSTLSNVNPWARLRSGLLVTT